MNMFDELNTDDLQNQLEEVIGNITKFFEKTEENTEEGEGSTPQSKPNIPTLKTFFFFSKNKNSSKNRKY